MFQNNIFSFHLQISVYEPVHFKVVIVLAKWVDKNLCDFKPAHIEKELEEGEDRDDEVDVVALQLSGGVEELAAHQRGEGECVDCQGDHLMPTVQYSASWTKAAGRNAGEIYYRKM